MSILTSFRKTLFTSALMLTSVSTQAATISFSGSISYIYTNSGGVFTTAGIGDDISVNTGYGDNAGDASFIDVQANQTWWDFSPGSGIGGTLTVDNSGSFSMASSGISVRNDYAFSDSNFLDNLLNQTYSPSIANGTPVDAWQVTGESADGTLGFGLFLTSLDSSLYSNMDYAVNPPSWSDIDYASFAIREVDSGGNLIYMAFGTVDNINGAAPVPLPGAVWLLGSGLVGLLGIAARRRVA